MVNRRQLLNRCPLSARWPSRPGPLDHPYGESRRSRRPGLLQFLELRPEGGRFTNVAA